jgi:hypothetical protein
MKPKRFRVPSLSQAELNDRTHKALAAIGTPHHIQASFFARLALESLASDRAVLRPLRPSVRDHSSTAWIVAFQVIENMLQTAGMSLSFDTFNLERTDSRQRMNVGIVTHLYGKGDFIRQLVRVTEPFRALPLRERIALIE